MGVAGDASGAPTPPAGDDGDSPARRGRLWGASGRTRNAINAAAFQESRRAGFTLMEMLMTVVIIAILASVALPNYTRAVQRGRGRSARDVLLTIFAGEKTYQAVNGRYLQVPSGAALATWQAVFMEHPDLNTDVRFSVPDTVDNPGTGTDQFNAMASYGGAANDFMQINETGAITCLQTTGIFADSPWTGCMQ